MPSSFRGLKAPAPSANYRPKFHPSGVAEIGGGLKPCPSKHGFCRDLQAFDAVQAESDYLISVVPTYTLQPVVWQVMLL